VTIEANGTQLPPVVVARGCLAALLGPLMRLITWIARRMRK
jgi:hypothetical protein